MSEFTLREWYDLRKEVMSSIQEEKDQTKRLQLIKDSQQIWQEMLKIAKSCMKQQNWVTHR